MHDLLGKYSVQTDVVSSLSYVQNNPAFSLRLTLYLLFNVFDDNFLQQNSSNHA